MVTIEIILLVLLIIASVLYVILVVDALQSLREIKKNRDIAYKIAKDYAEAKGLEIVDEREKR